MATSRDEVGEVARWAEGIERVHECIGGRFRRPEPRRRALDYLRGLISPVERKNRWQLAEQAGHATPDGVRRLLSSYRWDAGLVRDDLRNYVVEHLADAGGVLVVDGTGFLKKGNKSKGNKSVGVHPLGYKGSTAARRGGLKTARLAYSWPTPAPEAGPCWTGNCICPKCGRRTWFAGMRPGRRRMSYSGPSRGWPRVCWSGHWNQRCPLVGLPGVGLRQRPRPAVVAGGGGESPCAGHQAQREAVGLYGKGTPPSEGGPVDGPG